MQFRVCLQFQLISDICYMTVRTSIVLAPQAPHHKPPFVPTVIHSHLPVSFLPQDVSSCPCCSVSVLREYQYPASAAFVSICSYVLTVIPSLYFKPLHWLLSASVRVFVFVSKSPKLSWVLFSHDQALLNCRILSFCFEPLSHHTLWQFFVIKTGKKKNLSFFFSKLHSGTFHLNGVDMFQ